MDRPTDHMTIREAAAALDLRPDTLRRYCSRGTIRARKLGWQLLIPPDEVVRYSRERRGPGRPAQNPPQPVG